MFFLHPWNRQVILLILIYISLGSVKAQVGFPYCEDFGGGTSQSSTVFGGSARLVDGVLRLTDVQENQYGYIYIDIPFPSSLGIKASFEYFSYGGSGADGLTAFLFDADVDQFYPGGFGGSLGYSPREGSNSQGMSRGFIGVGFDSFGNFGNSSEGKNGGFPGLSDQRHPNAIVVRGPGSSATGYEFVIGRKTNSDGENGLPIADLFPLSSGGFGTRRVTEPAVAGYRKVFFNLKPALNGIGFLLSIDMLVTTESDNPRSVNIFDKVSYPYAAPRSLKIGFAASTGGETNYHEIRNLIVEVSDEDNLLEPIAYDIDDRASCEGKENTYSISGDQLILPNQNSIIRCLQLYASLDDIEAEADDICSQARCRPENREMVLPQGVFRAGDEGGDFTFFPNYGFTDERVRIFYTVTDNYGKTSSGNYIELLIQESPDPVSLEIAGAEEGVESLRICDGDIVQFVATGEEDYFRYEWFRDDVLLSGPDQSELEISLSGLYKVLAYNSNGCAAKSRSIEVIIPPYPEFKIDSQIVGCEGGQVFDLRTSITGYYDMLYDYHLQSPDGDVLLNEEIAMVSQAGEYVLKAKHKDLDCYSDPIIFSIVINEEQLQPDFDFEVDGTGIKDEEGGGIFIDDPIRFMDRTEGNVMDRFWDFGDESSSRDQSPVHVFGKKGTFIISLTVTDMLGCETTISEPFTIDLSYRVMFPTGFTPDSQDNQFFRPKTKGILKMEMLVFNNWGELIFQTDDIHAPGWDGTRDGDLLPAGNYVYRANMESVDGEKINRAGKFLLVR